MINDNLDEEMIDTEQVSEEELDDLFTNPGSKVSSLSKEELIEQALRNSAYDGPNSFAEGRDMVLKNKGKEWDEIPENERYCYVLLNVAVSSKPSPTGNVGLGYDPGRRGLNNRGATPGGSNLSLTRTAIEWGGMFVTTQDPQTKEVKKVRLDDSKNIPISCSFFMPAETFRIIEDMMNAMNTQVVNIGIIAGAEISLQPLDQQSRREQYNQLKREAKDSDMKLDPANENEDAFVSLAATLSANLFIDKSTIKPAAQVNLNLVETDPTKLVLRMNQTTVAGFKSSRDIRREQVKREDVAASNSNAPDPLNQMDVVAAEAEQAGVNL